VSLGPPFMRSSDSVSPTRTHGDSRARGRYEDTSIWVQGLVDIHVEVDPTVHPGCQYVDSPTVVHEGMRLVWIPGDYSPWMPVDEFLVKPLGIGIDQSI